MTVPLGAVGKSLRMLSVEIAPTGFVGLVVRCGTGQARGLGRWVTGSPHAEMHRRRMGENHHSLASRGRRSVLGRCIEHMRPKLEHRKPRRGTQPKSLIGDLRAPV